MIAQRIGRYEVLYPLSRGGMAMVYLARDPAFERQVAIKVLPPQFTHDPQFRGRFEREAKVIAGLEHPYIVPVYDYGEEGDQPFIVMRYMPGGTLADRIAGQPLPFEQTVPIFQRLAEAVDAVHRHGIVHCDLKPSNVLFDMEGRAFLSDFGISKLLETSGKAGVGGSLIGTPAYMSPEQCVGNAPLDGRSDVYSLGLILYEMLSGIHPYGEAEISTKEMMEKQISEPPPPLDGDRLNLPAEINSILAWALAKRPESRYATAGMMARGLTALYADNAQVHISKPGFAPRISRPVSPVMPTPSAAGGRNKNGLDVFRPTRPLPEATTLESRRRRWLIVGFISIPLALALCAFMYWNNPPFGFGQPNSTITPTNTATVSSVASATPTPTDTAVPLSPTPSPTALVPSPTNTATRTPIPSDTATSTATATLTATATRRTTTLPTFTPTVPTNTPMPPPTNANTNPPPPNTDTPAPPLPTATDTLVPTPTDTPMPTATFTAAP